MKRALTFLVAVVSCWTVSFVQAANVELKFYSGVPGEYVAAVEDLHYAVVSVDGETLAKETLEAEDKGKAEADIETNEFYVIAEQPSTKFFGSVLVNKDEDDDELFFILDASGLIWVKDAHRCPDDAECMQDGAEGVWDCCDDRFVGKQHNGERYENGQCCDDDCCDADCICRRLAAYLAKGADGVNDVAGNVGTGKNTSTNGQSALQGSQSSARTSTGSNTISRPPYSSGASNFGTTGTGTSPYGGAVGAAGGLSSLGMLGMIGAVIAVSVTKNSTSPSGTSAESK